MLWARFSDHGLLLTVGGGRFPSEDLPFHGKEVGAVPPKSPSHSERSSGSGGGLLRFGVKRAGSSSASLSFLISEMGAVVRP